MGIIFFCLTFGTVLGSLGKKAQVVAKFFKIIDEVIMKMVSAIMWLSPIGISSVICAKILGVANLAFPTASTAAALPTTFRCVEKNHVDPRISKFVLPIGATVNMDGTALFVTMTKIFIAQMHNITSDCEGTELAEISAKDYL